MLLLGDQVRERRESKRAILAEAVEDATREAAYVGGGWDYDDGEISGDPKWDFPAWVSK